MRWADAIAASALFFCANPFACSPFSLRVCQSEDATAKPVDLL